MVKKKETIDEKAKRMAKDIKFEWRKPVHMRMRQDVSDEQLLKALRTFMRFASIPMDFIDQKYVAEFTDDIWEDIAVLKELDFKEEDFEDPKKVKEEKEEK